MPETKGLVQYQVEAQKRRQKTTLNLWVSQIRGPRGRKKLLGEAYTKDSNTPAIYFRVDNAKKEDDVYEEFLRLLVHRGYLPTKVRQLKENRFDEWKDIEYGSIEAPDLTRVLQQEGLAPKEKRS